MRSYEFSSLGSNGILDVPPRAGLGLLEQRAFEVLLGRLDAELGQSFAVDARPRWMGSDQRVADVEEDGLGRAGSLPVFDAQAEQIHGPDSGLDEAAADALRQEQRASGHSPYGTTSALPPRRAVRTRSRRRCAPARSIPRADPAPRCCLRPATVVAQPTDQRSQVRNVGSRSKLEHVDAAAGLERVGRIGRPPRRIVTLIPIDLSCLTICAAQSRRHSPQPHSSGNPCIVTSNVRPAISSSAAVRSGSATGGPERACPACPADRRSSVGDPERKCSSERCGRGRGPPPVGRPDR